MRIITAPLRQTIMRDKWMNSGCNEEELKPYVEPEHCLDDPRRIEQLVALGYARADIEDSLRQAKFDDIYATYLLMGRRAADVSNREGWQREGGVDDVRCGVLVA